MNKYKKNLESLKRHLGRDTAALGLLDAVARDITEMRKQIADLTSSESAAMERAEGCKRQLIDAQQEAIELRHSLEAERSRARSASSAVASLTNRIAELEAEDPVEDEISLGADAGPDASQVADLFKAVRKRYKKIPVNDPGRRVFVLEELVKDFSQDQFTGLGMLMAVCALFKVPAYVEADRTINDIKGWRKEHTEKFVHWYRSWIQVSPLEDRIHEACDSIKSKMIADIRSHQIQLYGG